MSRSQPLTSIVTDAIILRDPYRALLSPMDGV